MSTASSRDVFYYASDVLRGDYEDKYKFNGKNLGDKDVEYTIIPYDVAEAMRDTTGMDDTTKEIIQKGLAKFDREMAGHKWFLVEMNDHKEADNLAEYGLRLLLKRGSSKAQFIEGKAGTKNLYIMKYVGEGALKPREVYETLIEPIRSGTSDNYLKYFIYLGETTLQESTSEVDDDDSVSAAILKYSGFADWGDTKYEFNMTQMRKNMQTALSMFVPDDTKIFKINWDVKIDTLISKDYLFQLWEKLDDLETLKMKTENKELLKFYYYLCILKKVIDVDWTIEKIRREIPDSFKPGVQRVIERIAKSIQNTENEMRRYGLYDDYRFDFSVSTAIGAPAALRASGVARVGDAVTDFPGGKLLLKMVKAKRQNANTIELYSEQRQKNITQSKTLETAQTTMKKQKEALEEKERMYEFALLRLENKDKKLAEEQSKLQTKSIALDAANSKLKVTNDIITSLNGIRSDVEKKVPTICSDVTDPTCILDIVSNLRNITQTAFDELDNTKTELLREQTGKKTTLNELTATKTQLSLEKVKYTDLEKTNKQLQDGWKGFEDRVYNKLDEKTRKKCNQLTETKTKEECILDYIAESQQGILQTSFSTVRSLLPFSGFKSSDSKTGASDTSASANTKPAPARTPLPGSKTKKMLFPLLVPVSMRRPKYNQANTEGTIIISVDEAQKYKLQDEIPYGVYVPDEDENEDDEDNFMNLYFKFDISTPRDPNKMSTFSVSAPTNDLQFIEEEYDGDENISKVFYLKPMTRSTTPQKIYSVLEASNVEFVVGDQIKAKSLCANIKKEDECHHPPCQWSGDTNQCDPIDKKSLVEFFNNEKAPLKKLRKNIRMISKILANDKPSDALKKKITLELYALITNGESPENIDNLGWLDVIALVNEKVPKGKPDNFYDTINRRVKQIIKGLKVLGIGGTLAVAIANAPGFIDDIKTMQSSSNLDYCKNVTELADPNNNGALKNLNNVWFWQDLIEDNSKLEPFMKVDNCPMQDVHGKNMLNNTIVNEVEWEFEINGVKKDHPKFKLPGTNIVGDVFKDFQFNPGSVVSFKIGKKDMFTDKVNIRDLNDFDNSYLVKTIMENIQTKIQADPKTYITDSYFSGIVPNEGAVNKLAYDEIKNATETLHGLRINKIVEKREELAIKGTRLTEIQTNLELERRLALSEASLQVWGLEAQRESLVEEIVDIENEIRVLEEKIQASPAHTSAAINDAIDHVRTLVQ